jgi:tryptophan-rich sensory protein
MLRVVFTYVVFVVVVMAVGAGVGASVVPGDWYAGLIKPWFSPPNWLFGPVWTTLYALIGWVGARKWLYGGESKLWWGQMAVNLMWSPVFFGLQLPWVAMAVIVTMWSLIAVFIWREWRSDRLSAVLFLPYLLWVSIATALNAAIVVLN